MDPPVSSPDSKLNALLPVDWAAFAGNTGGNACSSPDIGDGNKLWSTADVDETSSALWNTPDFDSTGSLLWSTPDFGTPANAYMHFARLSSWPSDITSPLHHSAMEP
uniref:Uncharacterized protein n=1 Tax=Mycena chlorophos TaxID=658473 RepID=A0ABQ0L183_MYCCL|nr:predicted protein [Mycena chlorophos]